MFPRVQLRDPQIKAGLEFALPNQEFMVLTGQFSYVKEGAE